MVERRQATCWCFFPEPPKFDDARERWSPSQYGVV
jgi:hypothetical protein